MAVGKSTISGKKRYEVPPEIRAIFMLSLYPSLLQMLDKNPTFHIYCF